jgi:hypothetical protein
LIKAMVRKGLEKRLPSGYDIETHFKPRYGPWDQRMCLVPDGDLFEAICAGRASVATDQIDAFTEDGLRLQSGAELEADLIVTATGLNLQAFGGMQIAVDGRDVELSETMSYKGMMLSGVPNVAMTFGYTNASWTLKCDLTCGYVCRLLNHMDEHEYQQCMPQERDPSIDQQPFIDFSSSYVVRSIDRFPKQGASAPWRLYQNYALDIVSLRFGAIEDGVMQFSGSRSGRADEPHPSRRLNRCNRLVDVDREHTYERVGLSGNRLAQRGHAASHSKPPMHRAQRSPIATCSPRSAGHHPSVSSSAGHQVAGRGRSVLVRSLH